DDDRVDDRPIVQFRADPGQAVTLQLAFEGRETRNIGDSAVTAEEEPVPDEHAIAELHGVCGAEILDRSVAGWWPFRVGEQVVEGLAVLRDLTSLVPEDHDGRLIRSKKQVVAETIVREDERAGREEIGEPRGHVDLDFETPLF